MKRREVVSYPYEGPPKVRCSAHRKNGDQCKRWAIAGGNVCPVHGGSAGHVKRKAAARIEASLDRAATAIVRLMEDPTTPPAVKLAAARDLLDRGDVTSKTVPTTPPAPWQVLLQSIIVRDDAFTEGDWDSDDDGDLGPTRTDTSQTYRDRTERVTGSASAPRQRLATFGR